ncbi:MAG: MBOAT family O-acyltransferase [Lachnospiraceae bacterium]|nr:MBOAT family O-acyltransferase [Lachnospiraceae bacterium]
MYFLIPSKVRYIWLLFCSYYFYCSLDGAFVSLLIVSTILTWLAGGLVYKFEAINLRRLFLVLGVVINIMFLIIYKYEDFFLELSGSSIRLNLILPIGISFYTFQSLTYIFDIYNGDLKPEDNIFKYALFVSFFPLILSGPIERAKHLLPQLNLSNEFNTFRASEGLKLMLFGYFMKIVIVSRMTILTDYVFSDYKNKTSVALLIAVLAYTIQIYCDFQGYSLIAIGMCKIMGIEIINNFNQPYFAVSVSDFWRRWHISLSTWFRDYLYIPLGGNRRGKIRKYINILIVFVVSGLWHGANITFVIWGFLNGLYQVIGELLTPCKEKLTSLLSIDKKPCLNRVLRTTITFILISFTWIFFRAPSVNEAIEIVTRIFSTFSYVNLFDGTIWNVGLGINNMLFSMAAIIILIVADVLCERKACQVSDIMKNVRTPIRWAVYYLLIIMILLSMNLNMTEFIYSGF